MTIKIEQLTHEQEITLLKALANQTPTDNGASRVVFDVSNRWLGDVVGITIPGNTPVVIKVALGMGGLNQMHNEVDLYRDYGDESLARVFFVGRYVEIMERVTVIDARDYAIVDRDEFISYMINDYSDQYSEDECHTMYDVIQFLHEINGYTGDNGQIGITEDGRFVAYDYGFPRNTGDVLTSDLSDYLDGDDFREYIYQLADLVTAEEEVFKNLETTICEWFYENYCY